MIEFGNYKKFMYYTGADLIIGGTNKTSQRGMFAPYGMPILVRTPKGKLIQVHIEHEKVKIKKVKKLIQYKSGIDVDKQRLYFNKIYMHDDEPISKYKIRHSSQIQLIVTVKIFIRVMQGGKEFPLTVATSCKISKLKKLIAKREGINEQNQTLKFKNIELLDHTTLNKYKTNHTNFEINLFQRAPDLICKIYIMFNNDKFSITSNIMTDTIGDVKFRLTQRFTIPLPQQRLMFRGIELSDDSKTLRQCDIFPNCYIHLKICKIDAKLVHILKFHNFYNDLYDILNDNEYDLDLLNHMEEHDTDQFCEEFNLQISQRIKFRKLIKILQKYDDCKYECETLQLEEADDSIQLLIIGDLSVGKTSLMKRYVQNTFDDIDLSTTFVDMMKRKERLSDDWIMEITIWDTAGQEKFSSLNKSYYRKGDCIIICYDISNPNSFSNVSKWRNKIDDYCTDEAVIMLVGCKSDLSSENRLQFEEKAKRIIESKKWKKYNTVYCECSAKTGDNVKNLFKNAAELVLRRRKEIIEENKYAGKFDYTMHRTRERADTQFSLDDGFDGYKGQSSRIPMCC
eukprot:518837_1